MSGLATIQQSRFNEILKEEIDAIKKQLTEAQINMLCGPTEGVKAALNEMIDDQSLWGNIAHRPEYAGVNPASDENAQPRQQSDAEEIGFRASPALKVRNAETLDLIVNGGQTSANTHWVVFDILINSAVGFSNGVWPRMSATNKMDFMFKIAQRLGVATNTDTGWQDLNGMHRGQVVSALGNIKIHDNISVAEWLHPFDVNRTLVDTRHLVDSNIYQSAKYFALAVGGVAFIIGGALPTLAAVGTGILYAGIAATAFQGITYILDGDTNEGIMLIIQAIFERMGFKWAKGSLAHFAPKLKEFKSAFTGLGGSWRTFMTEIYHVFVVVMSGQHILQLCKSGRAEIPLRWNFTSNGCKNRFWRPSAMSTADGIEDLAQYRINNPSQSDGDCGDSNEEHEEFLRELAARQVVTIDEKGVQVVSGDGDDMASANEFMALHEGFELDLAELENVEEADFTSTQLIEIAIKNENEILTESRFQKLAGI